MNDSLDNYNTLISLLKNKIPFSLARFNDGEMKGIIQPGSLVARGDQKVSNSLSRKLLNSLKLEKKNYWKGAPCSKCFKPLRMAYDQIVQNYKYQTKATIFCNNGYWEKFISDFPLLIQNRKLVWISGKDQDLTKLQQIGISNDDIREHIKLPLQDSWSKYKTVKYQIKNLIDGDIVILSCGPLSRVLAAEWFYLKDTCTYIDSGSTFDPFTRNIWHRCHIKELKYCQECNYKTRENDNE